MCAPLRPGLCPRPRLVACGAPTPHAASSRARMCAPLRPGLCPRPRLVACGAPTPHARGLCAPLRSAPDPGSSLVGPRRPTPLPRGRACARRYDRGSAPDPGSASSVGATPRTPRGRFAGTPKAPLRVRGARTCAPLRPGPSDVSAGEALLLLLPPASCLLPPASCLLPPASPASCLLPPASCLLPPASCLLTSRKSPLTRRSPGESDTAPVSYTGCCEACRSPRRSSRCSSHVPGASPRGTPARRPP